MLVFIFQIGKVVVLFGSLLIYDSILKPVRLRSFLNKKTPEGAYAGCVGVRKNYRYVEWQWKVE